MVNKKTTSKKQSTSVTDGKFIGSVNLLSKHLEPAVKITPFEELTSENQKAYFKSSITAAKGLIKQLKSELFTAQRSLNRIQKDYEKFKKKQQKKTMKKKQ